MYTERPVAFHLIGWPCRPAHIGAYCPGLRGIVYQAHAWLERVLGCPVVTTRVIDAGADYWMEAQPACQTRTAKKFYIAVATFTPRMNVLGHNDDRIFSASLGLPHVAHVAAFQLPPRRSFE